MVLADREVLFQSYPQLHITKIVGPMWKIAYGLWAPSESHVNTYTHNRGVTHTHWTSSMRGSHLVCRYSCVVIAFLFRLYCGVGQLRISTGFIFMITMVQVVKLIKNNNHTINYVKYRIELAIRKEVVPCAVGYVSAFF